MEGEFKMSIGEDQASQGRDWPRLLLLVVLILALRGWLIWNTEVTARDSIGYIRYALEFEKMPWDEVVRQNHQHPGYPFSIWLMSGAVRSIVQA